MQGADKTRGHNSFSIAAQKNLQTNSYGQISRLTIAMMYEQDKYADLQAYLYQGT